ncbi:MAG: cation:proton antiporter [Gammaproteobacteria bacterium]
MHFSIFEVILSVFFSALIVSVLFRHLKLSVILGYLVVGALVGPHALALVPDSEYIDKLAEFGIVFLMFTIGLEFSVAKLFALRYAVFIVGGLQVLGSVVITTMIGKLLGMSLAAALVAGSIVAMSSTALVVKQLNDQFELQSFHGMNAVAILLFQDLAVIPLVIVITSIANGGNDNEVLAITLLWALGKGVFAILLIFIMGRWLLKPLFRLIAKAHAIELFTLTVLLITLTTAWITQSLGLSYSLGAFLGGLMLAETAYRHQIEVEIRPFRDVLLALFFITIGMLTNVKTWYATWPWIGMLVFALTIGKMMLITLLSRLSGSYASTATRTGIVLAQGGEFGFAILSIAMSNKILSPEYQQVILAALLISLAIGPILIRYNKQIANFILPKARDLSESVSQKRIIEHAKKMQNHVVICGYGRVGQHIARLLDKLHFPYIAIDFDAELAQRAGLAGDEVIYGDSSHPGILRKAGVKHAKALLISLTDHRATVKILTMARTRYPELPILVRCRDKAELNQLKKLGATQVIAELFEASLTLSSHLLQVLQLPRTKIIEIIQDIRNTDYDLLNKIFIGAVEETPDDEMELHEQLSPIVISEEAYAANRKLSELDLKDLGVEVIAIRRGNDRHLKPRGNIKILPHDIIVIFGALSNLEIAERRLLDGAIS